MSTNPLRKNYFHVVIDLCLQSELVALNVENDPVVAEKTGCRVAGLHVSRTLPLGLFHFAYPSVQWRPYFRVSHCKIVEQLSA